MSDVAIRAEGLGKSYRIGPRYRYKALRDTLSTALYAPYRYLGRLSRQDGGHAEQKNNGVFWALKDLSFEIGRGEAIGIIGRNGAGKSTLLKILSRITEPTEGRAWLRGRVGSLLEVGTGFHPELTGRENVYLNGAILGMKKSEIAGRFDEIVDFADIEKFIDTPVKFYSSGMYVRLAFAVAAHIEPEILLLDEVLAVGDAEFQKKCLGKMREVGRSGRTVLFVSHTMGAIQTLCSRGLVIGNGRIAFDGPVDEAVKHYLSELATGAENALDDPSERPGNGWVRLVNARVLNELDQPSQYLIAGRPAALELTYTNPSATKHINLSVTVFNQLGTAVTCFDAILTDRVFRDLGPDGRWVCSIPNLPLPVGQYRVAVGLRDRDVVLDQIPNALAFEVESSTFFSSGRTPSLHRGSCMVEHSWRHEPAGA